MTNTWIEQSNIPSLVYFSARARRIIEAFVYTEGELMGMRTWRVWGVFLACCLASGSLAADQGAVEVIQLKYHSAEQELPLVQPFVGEDGAVTGLRNQLIVRTTPARMEQIKALVARIDVPVRRLMVTVRYGGQMEEEAGQAELSGSIGVGSHGRVTVPPTGTRGAAEVGMGQGTDRLRARITSTRTLSDGKDTQQIQVLEGNEAFIRTGKSVPIYDRTVVRGAQGLAIVDSTSYRDVGSGFYVKPVVSGDNVTLWISPQREQVSGTGEIKTQQAQTVVSGRLGEWITVGGVAEERAGSREAQLYSSSDASIDRQSIQIRVEEIQ
jgi:hypothetical protein